MHAQTHTHTHTHTHALSLSHTDTHPRLGFTELTWSTPYHWHTSLKWEQLDVHAQRHWTVLGYTRYLWDESDDTPAPCNKDWDDLTAVCTYVL